MQRLEVLGWWFSPFAPSSLPRPQLLVGAWPPAQRSAVLGYLRAGQPLVHYADASFCRFACGEPELGNRDLTDGEFVWPDGLAHYVDVHDVRLPEPFVAHVMARGGTVPPFRLPQATFGSYDSGPWQRWARARHACLDLDGFELPDAEVCERIAEELDDVVYEQILLCRGITREVVLAVDDGAIELRQLCAGGRAPRRFHGWHEWPIAGIDDEPGAGPAPAT